MPPDDRTLAPIPALLTNLEGVVEQIGAQSYLSTHLVSRSHHEDRIGDQETALALARRVLEVIEPLEDSFCETKSLENLAIRLDNMASYPTDGKHRPCR